MKATKRITALLMSIVLLIGLMPSVFAFETDALPTVGENFIIASDGKAWTWDTGEEMQKLSDNHKFICHSDTSTYTVNKDGDLYLVDSESDEPRYMLDSSGASTVNINSKRNKIMSGVSKILGNNETPLFVLKTNGELWIIPFTAGRNYRALTGVEDIISANENTVFTLTADGKAYRCENLPYVSKAEVELAATNVKKLCGADGDSLIYINEENELLSSADRSVIAENIIDAAADKLNVYTINADGQLFCTSNGTEILLSEETRFVSVSASNTDLGCVAVDENGAVWAWKSCVPYDYYYYGDELVKIFESDSPVKTAFQNPINFNAEANANLFDESVTLSFTPIEGAVGYLINGSREFAAGTEMNGLLNITLPVYDEYTILAINESGYAFAKSEVKYEAADMSTVGLTVTRENLFQQNVVIGDVIDEHITISADKKASAGYRVYNGRTIVYDSGYIWNGKTIDIDGINYTPTANGVYTFEVYAATSNEQKSITFNVGFLSAPYTDSSFIKVDETNGVYEIRHMYSATISGKPRNLYLYSDRGELDSFYAVDADGSETFIGVGSAMIPANSGITRFIVKSNIPGVSVVSFGYGDRFISYMSGNTMVAYENAAPIYSMFANSGMAVMATVNINSLSDVAANEKYFVSLSEKATLTASETELAVKAINIVTMFGSDKLSDELLIALDRLAGKVSGIKYSVFYEYELMTVSEMMPQSITADGLLLACNKSNAVYLNSLFLRFSQMKTPHFDSSKLDSLIMFKLALWNNGAEVPMNAPVIITMKMPSGYVHKDNYKLKLSSENSVASWLDYIYDKTDNTITFRTNSFGTFEIQPYNGTINNNDYENILNWFTQNQKTVAFVDSEGKVISVQSVFIGKSAVAPTAPAREGYTFTGWDKTFDNIKDNLVVTAVYEKDKTTTDKPSVSVDVENSKSSFTDMQNHWANGYVGVLEKLDVFKNLFIGTFNPDLPMTRGMYIILVSRVIGEDSQWLYENGIILGYGNDDYGLTDEVTREQIAVITKRLIDKLDITVEANMGKKVYADAENISDWAREAVEYNYSIGCMVGDDAGRFNPQSNVTNAEIATMLYRIAGYTGAIE